MTVPSDLCFNLAPTGVVPTRDMSQFVPLRPDEIARDVLKAATLGITAVHLHARDEDGKPTYRKEVYAKIIDRIRSEAPELVICVSCSGRNAQEIEKRAEVLNLVGDLKPDMASLTLSSLNFSRGASINEPDTVKELASRMQGSGIRPELEIFDLGMANYASYLMSRGFIESPLYANVLVGNVASAQADLLSIAALIQALPSGCLWSLAGLGNAQLQVAGTAASFAPGVRIGLEDNLWRDRSRQSLATNEDLVRKVHTLAQTLDRQVMKPAKLRELLGLAVY